MSKILIFLKKFGSRKFLTAVLGVLVGLAVIFGIDGNEISTIAGALTAVGSCVVYIKEEGKIDAERIKNAAEKINDVIDAIKDE